MKYGNCEMQEAGREPEKPKEVAAGGEESGGKVRPTIHIYDGELPGADKLEAGKKYIAHALVEVTHKNTDEDKDGKKHNATLAIHKIGFEPHKEKKSSEKSDRELNESINDMTKEG